MVISSDIFAKMLDEHALKYAHSYLTEECTALVSFLVRLKASNKNAFNLCVIGDATQSYRDIALDYDLNYIAIDPLLPSNSNGDHRIRLLRKPFEFVLSDEIPQSHNIFVFTFNVFRHRSYSLNNIKRLSKPGDVLWLSGWTNTQLASQTMSKYFSYIYGNCCPSTVPSLSSLEGVDFSFMSDQIKRCQFSICETLEIYL